MQQREIDYPAELTFKSVFKNRDHILSEIEQALADSGVQGSIMFRESSGSKFVSYTVRATFSSHGELQGLCSVISKIDGFMMMI